MMEFDKAMRVARAVRGLGSIDLCEVSDEELKLKAFAMFGIDLDSASEIESFRKIAGHLLENGFIKGHK